jgi:hypothetical protein
MKDEAHSLNRAAERSRREDRRERVTLMSDPKDPQLLTNADRDCRRGRRFDRQGNPEKS